MSCGRRESAVGGASLSSPPEIGADMQLNDTSRTLGPGRAIACPPRPVISASARECVSLRSEPRVRSVVDGPAATGTPRGRAHATTLHAGFAIIVAVVFIMAAALQGATPRPLVTLEYTVAGTQLRVTPSSLSVPK